MSTPSIVFFGSGPVALRNLELLRGELELEAIITKPSTEAEMRARFQDTTVLAVADRVELDALIANRPFTSSLGLLIDFGIIVSEQVIQAFPMGIINSHFSLLPEWRGADPITFAVLSGQEQTGVSLMLLSKGMDEGLLIAQEAHTISRDTTTSELTIELISLSAKLLRTTIPAYAAGDVRAYPQTAGLLGKHAKPTYSRKLTKEDGRIDWTKPAIVLEREIRAFKGWPGSYTEIAGKEITITSARVVDKSGTVGEAKVDGKNLYVYCGDKALEILTLKPAGKKEMAAAAFLAGYGRLL